jgi:oligoribonuclease NrnB/cAMP/cGMP phosphodiesterase (DHH superfamily)
MNCSPESVDFVIYHGNCTDGFGAAWSAWKKLGNKAEYFAAHHDQGPPSVKGKNVAILDFSYSKEDTEKILKEANSLIILDHHKTNQETLKDAEYAIFDMNRSGAVMAWNFFHPEKEVPLFIQYIQDRDLWRWSLPNSKEFSSAFYEVPFSFDEYDKFLKSGAVDRAILYGSYILKYVDNQVNSLSKSAIDRKLLGYKCKVINSSVYRSELGNKLASDCDGIGIVWSFNHKKMTVHISFRSNDARHDVAEVCQVLKSRGFSYNENAGGHAQAAGFILSPKYSIEDIFDDPANHQLNQNT